MTQHQENTIGDTEKNAPLVTINELVDRLDSCISLPAQNSDISEVSKILGSLRVCLTDTYIRNRLTSDTQITQQQLPNIFARLCKISIAFSSSISNYPLFPVIISPIWNMIHLHLPLSIEKEIQSAKEYYTLAMDGLNTKEFCAYFIKNDTNDIIKFYVRIFLKLAKSVIWADSRRMEKLSLSEYTAHKCLHEEKYDTVFHNIITFIDHFFTLKNTEAAENDCISIMFSLIVVISDSKSFLPTTVRMGFPAKLVAWLHMISIRNIASDPLNSLIVAVSNISQCEEGMVALNEANAIDTLELSEKALSDRLEKSPSTSSFYPRIYAMIGTAEQSKTRAVFKSAIDFLLSKICEADVGNNLRSTTGHLYEYLVPLAKLLVNDNVATYLLNNQEIGGLKFFIALFHKHNILSDNDLFVKHLIRLALYNILCSLTFHQSVQQELKEDQTFINAILEASNSSISNTEAFIPSSLRSGLMSVKAAADGILVYLDKFNIPISNDEQTIDQSNKKVPMVSYSHKDANFCRSMVAALKERSISVWVDEDEHCLSDDCWEEIAIAIKNASIILIIVSENYCTKSDSCRVEATYAIRLKIPIIAIYIDENYQAEPWLDIHLTGLYVKFGNKPFSERMNRLAKYITAREDASKEAKTAQMEAKNFSHEVIMPSTTKEDNGSPKSRVSETNIQFFVSNKLPHTWSKLEVNAWWCTERNLIPELCTFCDGEALCVYAQLFLSLYQQDSLKHLERLRQQLNQQHDINLFDDQYANLVSSMMWISKQKDENREHQIDTNSKSALCILS